jgi:phosphodiesterase/alkaline phosphatase D-like protein
MGADNEQSDFTMSRRRVLTTLGLGSGALAAATLNIAPDARAAILVDSSPASAGAPPVVGLHLQFGADASTEITVSWHTPQPVANPRVALGRLDGRLEGTAIAKPASYVDAKSSQTVYAWHAKLAGLDPNSVYMYAAVHDDAAPEFGTFRTVPRGRAAARPTPSQASAIRAHRLLAKGSSR